MEYTYTPAPRLIERPAVTASPARSGETVSMRVYAVTVKMFVAMRLCQDMLDEMLNMPQVAGKFRYELSRCYEFIYKPRRRLVRTAGAEDMAAYEEMVCEIVDSCDAHIKVARVWILDALANKVRYDLVHAATCLGMAGGFIDIAQQLHKRMTGRRNPDFSMVYDYLKDIDRKMCIEPMNEGIEPDYKKCQGAIMNLYKELEKATVSALGARLDTLKN